MDHAGAAIGTLLAVLYGLSQGLLEGPERALVADSAAGEGRGRAFGVYNMAIGFAALAASTLFGLAWDHWGSAVAFAGSGAFALAAVGALLLLVPADRQVV